MSKHIDYEEEAKFRVWWLNNTGGAARDSLTVRDYFAVAALPVMLDMVKRNLEVGGIQDGELWDWDWSADSEDLEALAQQAYELANAMMKERAK